MSALRIERQNRIAEKRNRAGRSAVKRADCLLNVAYKLDIAGSRKLSGLTHGIRLLKDNCRAGINNSFDRIVVLRIELNGAAGESDRTLRCCARECCREFLRFVVRSRNQKLFAVKHFDARQQDGRIKAAARLERIAELPGRFSDYSTALLIVKRYLLAAFIEVRCICDVYRVFAENGNRIGINERLRMHGIAVVVDQAQVVGHINAGNVKDAAA